MPRTELMTWEPKTCRWLKEYKGKMKSVSCRQLGTAKTKEASLAAANTWWTAKELELSGTTERQQAGATLRQMASAADSAWQSEFLTGQALAVETGDGRLPEIDKPFARLDSTDTAVWQDRIKRTKAKAKALPTLDFILTTWTSQHRGFVGNGISVGRFDTLRTHITRFVNWMGREKRAEAIDESTLIGFVASLLAEIEKGKTPTKRTKSACGRKEGISPVYADSLMVSVKAFINWLYEFRYLEALPRNLNSSRLRIAKGKKTIKTIDKQTVSTLLAGCDEQAPRTKLYLLLMLNCGMYQQDIADLALAEIDLTGETITRPRSKTPNGPVATYFLWPPTLDLLRQFVRHDNSTVKNKWGMPVALLNEDGGALVNLELRANDKITRKDNIKSAYFRLCKRLQLTDAPPLKLFRKTAASELGTHKEYKYYTTYFLGHSPRTVADNHYVKPDVLQFRDALIWLGKQYGF